MKNPHARFSSTTTYAGQTRQHDYNITVRHSPWRTRIVALSIDGIEQLDPAPGSQHSDQIDVELPLAEARTEAPGAEDAKPNVEIRLHGWLTLRIVVRRPTVKGTMVDREEIHVTTAALGGAGEAEVHEGGTVTPLLPEVGSRSEQRDLRRTANPTAYALVAALTTALRLCVPLLGLGALLSFLSETVKAWLSRILSPILDPVFAWLGQLLEPVGRVLSAIGQFLGRIIDFLFGWLPDIHLPFDIPDWVWTVAKISLFALIAFSANKSNLKRRQKPLNEARTNLRISANDRADHKFE